MARRTLQLCQILFVLFAIYSVVYFTGNQQRVIPVLCLIVAYGFERLQGVTRERLETKSTTAKFKTKIIEKDVTADHLDSLLKSRNPLIITDAVQYLLHDLGLLVSKASNSQIISRLVKSNVEDTPIGLIVLLDVSGIDTGWSEWDKIAQFAETQEEGYRTLIIWSNCFETKDGKMKFHKFPTHTKKILASKKMVALGTYTFYSLCNLCKTGKLDIHSVLGGIRNFPGGVITLKK